jgi:hypothetical protein
MDMSLIMTGRARDDYIFLQVSLRKGNNSDSPLVEPNLIAVQQLGINTPLTDELVIQVLHKMYRKGAIQLARIVITEELHGG